MIKGMGVDIIEVSRIKQSIEKNSNFKKRMFTEREVEYCERFNEPYTHYAARFAVKEAFFKATGFKIPFNEISVENREDGAPFIHLKKEIKGNLVVSITHIRELAVAVVVYEE